MKEGLLSSIGPSMVERASDDGAWVHFCHGRLNDLPQVLLRRPSVACALLREGEISLAVR